MLFHFLPYVGHIALPMHSALHSPPDHHDLLSKVAAKARDKWEQVAELLDIKLSRIHSIRTVKQAQPIYCYIEIFDVWKRKGSPPYTWATIINALRAPSVGKKRLANELQEWLLTTQWVLAWWHKYKCLQWQICTRANPGIRPGIKNTLNYIHKQNNDNHNWFNYQSSREGAQAVIFSSQKPPKPRFRDAKIQNFPGGEPPDPPLCFSFSILPRHQFRLRSATECLYNLYVTTGYTTRPASKPVDLVHNHATQLTRFKTDRQL